MLKRLIAGAVVTAAALVTVPGSVAHASGFGEVRGVVRDVATGFPDKNACVIIWIQDGINSPITVNVDSHGAYDALNVATGAWKSTAYDCVGTPKHAPAMYGGPNPALSIPGVDLASGAFVNVLDGVATTGVDFGLVKAAVTKITVRDSKTKLAIPNVSICPQEATNNTQMGFCGGTDATGKGVPIYGAPGAMKLNIIDNRASGSNPSPLGYPVNVWIGGTDFNTATVFNVVSGSNPGLKYLYVGDTTEVGTGTVTGVIKDKATGQVLPGACATAWTTSAVIQSPEADANGVYALTGVPNGNWEITAGSCGAATPHTNVVYKAKTGLDAEQATLVQVLNGQTTPKINFSLPLAGTVVATVTASDTGLPLQDVLVCPRASHLNPLMHNYQSGFCIYSDANGVATMIDVPGGANKFNTVFAGGVGYQDEWYQNKADFATATKVVVTTGASQNISIVLDPAVLGAPTHGSTHHTVNYVKTATGATRR